MADTKGERTRTRIVATAAPVFNQRGYAGASMADLMAAAGLEKGGLYRHFPSKEAIAVAAFDHAVALHRARIAAHLGAAPAGARVRLVAVAEAMLSLVEDPVLPGGCPIQNTAVESDDGDGPLYPALRARARRAMTRLLGVVHSVVAEGVAAGEFSPAADPEVEARTLVAMMEGALMLAKLFDDLTYVRQAVDRVRDRADALAGRPPGVGTPDVGASPAAR